jgi:hypothetical protein
MVNNTISVMTHGTRSASVSSRCTQTYEQEPATSVTRVAYHVTDVPKDSKAHHKVNEIQYALISTIWCQNRSTGTPACVRWNNGLVRRHM